MREKHTGKTTISTNVLIYSVMKFLKKISSFFSSVVYFISNACLSTEERLNLLSDSSSIRMDLIKRWGSKGHQFVTLLKSLRMNGALHVDFFTNFMNNNKLYESQLGQDCFVDAILKNKTQGIFIEIGVGDGITLSNTYFLEKYRDWDGLLCEPSRCFHQSIRESRDSKLVPYAIFNQSDIELDFVEVQGGEELSTIKKYVDADKHNRTNNIEYSVSTITFNDLCSNYLDTSKIDYLSVDTEGSEYEILSAIDFKSFDISIISVEHNYNTKKMSLISELLLKNDYVEIDGDLFSWDTIFIKKYLLQPH
jgi:FkbM family methyltransferase